MAKPKAKVEKKVEKKAKKAGVEEVLVTQEYFDAHPELEAEGVKVGDTIEVAETPKTTSSKLDLNGEVSILRGEEYIRTYPKGSKEGVESFLSKDGGKYVAVKPDSIVSITVSWRESIKVKEEGTGRTIDTGRMAAKAVKFTEKTHGAKFKEEARALANSAPKRSCIAVLG